MHLGPDPRPSEASARMHAGGGDDKKPHELAVTPRSTDFAQWYSDVIIKGELLSRYNIPGLFVLRPAAFAMWEAIQAWFDAKIKTIGVENCMFPLFIREDVLSKEEAHLEVRPPVPAACALQPAPAAV